MSKRLQVLVDERELRQIRRVARQAHMTVAEWVRQALREAYRREPEIGVESKLRTLKMAFSHSYPTGDIRQMLGEIEQGYESQGSD